MLFLYQVFIMLCYQMHNKIRSINQAHKSNLLFLKLKLWLLIKQQGNLLLHCDMNTLTLLAPKITLVVFGYMKQHYH